MQIEPFNPLLMSHLQRINLEEDPAGLCEAYTQLRAGLAHLLFEVNDYDSDQYAWLLMNQDAGGALDRLLVTHQLWQQAPAKAGLWAVYQQALTDFRWLVNLAIQCSP